MRLKAFAATASLMVLTLAAVPAAAQPMNEVGSPWRGMYLDLGGNVGEIFSGNKLEFQDLTPGHPLSFTSNNVDSAVIGGAQLGQWWPMGGAVIGLESDIDFGKNLKYLSSLRGQLGLPMGSFLLYGTGGLGMEIAHEEFSVSSTSGEIDNFIGDQKKYGWVAGGGIQAMIAPRLSLGVEALYYGLGKDTTALATIQGGEPFNMVEDRNFAVVRARLDFHFTNFW
jgi:opacity protein-like surface antigen